MLLLVERCAEDQNFIALAGCVTERQEETRWSRLVLENIYLLQYITEFTELNLIDRCDG